MKVTCLPNGPLVLCFEFVGPGSYRLVAGTCRRFRKLYLKVEPQKRTFWKNAALSIFHAELCLRDHELVARTRMERQKIVRSLVFDVPARLPESHEVLRSLVFPPARRHPTFQEQLLICMKRLEALEQLAFEAAVHGRRDVLDLTQTRGLDLTTATRHDQTLVDVAVKCGQIPVLESLRENGCELIAETWEWPILRGRLNVLRFLHERGCPWLERGFDLAVTIGNLATVKILYEIGYERNAGRAVTIATSMGHLEIIRYLFEVGGDEFVVHTTICSYGAAALSHIHVLQYLHERGHAFDGIACKCACRRGKLEALQYLVEHGSTWDDEEREQGVQFAAEFGHDHVVQWIRDRF